MNETVMTGGTRRERHRGDLLRHAVPVTTSNGGHLKQATGTLTGGVNSSATSWTPSVNSYRVILHCTSDPNHAFYF